MAYNSSYNDGDISEAAVDGIVKILIAFASLATLVGLTVMFVYLRKRMKG